MEKQSEILRDKDIREPLFDFLERRYKKVRIIEEKTMGKSRADIVMVTEDMLYGLEIKSDADTYARLERQIVDYNKFFDRNFVVAGKSHAGSIERHVPDFWGIIIVEIINGDVKIELLREPLENVRPDRRRKLIRQLRFLWRPEVNNLLLINALPKYEYLGKHKVVDKLMEKVDHELLKKQCMNELFERDYQKTLKEIETYRKRHAKKK